MAHGKKLSKQAEIGQRGVNLVESIVLEMGCAWHPLNASLDVGIDGEIELVHPSTRAATNAIIRVQSKATLQAFPTETAAQFHWPCDERDIEYWMSGNAPVVLVVSRPHLREAYWVDIKRYFADPLHRGQRRVLFDRARMRFSKDSLPELFNLAVPRDQGIYFAPPPRSETIYSNLLPVVLPGELWVGDTDVTTRREVGDRQGDQKHHEYFLRHGKILSVHDLTVAPWAAFIDQGTVERHDVSHWSLSSDRNDLSGFVELLNNCLTSRCGLVGCRRRLDEDGFYFFEATDDLTLRKIQYRSVRDAGGRGVFVPYRYTKGQRRGEISYYRHNAFVGAFERYEQDWFLRITPTYHFTIDGYRRHRFAQDLLRGIKRLERNATVLGQVAMWASVLRDGLSDHEQYPHLRFGNLAEFSIDVGIDDSSWLPNEEDDTARAVEASAADLPLFSQLSSESTLAGAPSDEA